MSFLKNLIVPHISLDIFDERRKKFMIMDANDDIDNNLSRLKSEDRTVLKIQNESIVTNKEISDTVFNNQSNLIILNISHHYN
ncbi:MULTISPECIES: hypothetical protein, partial [Enterobacteriaceae]